MVVMLKTYLDLGRKHDKSDDVMCVASVAFRPTKYKQFIRAWNPMLKAWGADEFHATDFYCGYGQFQRQTKEKQALFDEDCRRIPAMIANRIAICTNGFFPARRVQPSCHAAMERKIWHEHAFPCGAIVSHRQWLVATRQMQTRIFRLLYGDWRYR
jgi:hypothetical protein